MTTYLNLPAYGSPFWKDPVASSAALPTTDPNGSVRLALDTGTIYEYNGSSWNSVGSASEVLGPGSSSDGGIVLFDGTTGKLIKQATGTGYVKATSGVYGTEAAIDLTADVTGSLPIANGGTAGTTATTGFNNLSPVTTRGDLIVRGATNNQRLAVGAAARLLRSDGTDPSWAQAVLTTDVTGTLPVANGGTNSATSLNSNRNIVSSGGAIVESAAITANRALVSDSNGLPTHASTTTTTEIGYVSGVTSAIQTQIDGKQATIAAGTTAQFYRGDKSFQALNMAALTAVTSGSGQSSGIIGEVLTTSQASNTTSNVGSTGVWGYATSQSLTAGSWLVWGTVGFNENGATLTTSLSCGISASTSGSGISEFDTTVVSCLTSGANDLLFATPPVLVNISGTTTYYLNTKFFYTSGTPRHRGRIQALRIF